MKKLVRWLAVSLTLSCVVAALLAVLPAAQRAEAAPSDRPSLVYFPATAHHLGWAFLAFWRRAGGVPVLGYPISEETTENGRTVQYFERARLEYFPELAGTSSEVQLGLLQQLLLGNQTPFPHTAPAHWQRFPETGYSLSPAFKDFYTEKGGVALFGFPLSDEVQLGHIVAQYFQRARFERWSDGTITLGLVGREYVQARGLTNSTAARVAGAVDYDPAIWPEDWRTIVVDLKTQTLQALESGQVIRSSLISSGTRKHPTPTGTFKIEYKLLRQDMEGGSKEEGDEYKLPNVPYVMYFRRDGYAIHGTYWHRNFGHPMSHGCINAPTPLAEWLYEWAPEGTRVIIQ